MRTIGRRFQPGSSGNPAGRPKGSKDRLPRGALRAAFQEFIKSRNGHGHFVNVIERAVTSYLKRETHQRGKLALGVMELGAKVLDRIDQQQEGLGAGVTIIVHGIDPMRLRPGGTGAPQALAQSNTAGRGPRRQR